MDLNYISIIGSGTMGNGIAQVFAMKGFNVYLIDVDEQKLNKALSTISKSLEKLQSKGTISQEIRDNAIKTITPIIDYKNIPGNTQLVIEAIYENKLAKLELFKGLRNLLKPETIYASNTSSISITELSVHSDPERFIGMHFMNPVPLMKLVEIIRGFSTSDETFKTIKDLVLKLEKVPVEVYDYPGFIANRILMPMINEAIFALYEGAASKESIDDVMKLGMNHPMGPLTLADFIGLDVCLSIMEVLYNGFNDSKYRPCPLLKKMVAANKLGRKTGEGFYKYN